MAEPLSTPSKITAWLDCAHFLTLQHEVDSGVLVVESNPFGEMAQLLMTKGLEHERAVLDGYRAAGLSVFEVPERQDGESFAAWVERVGNPMAAGHDVVFQMPFAHEGIRGIADFLVRVVDPLTGASGYEPVDAKLARREAKPGHVLQLCFYTEAIAALTGSWPGHVRIALGSGAIEAIRVSDVLPYWRRLRGQLARVVEAPPATGTFPEPCDHCGFCRFEMVCEAQWRDSDSLVHVADVRRADRATLEAAGVTTIAGLAALDHDVAGLDPDRRSRFVRQAALQVLARDAPDDPPPHELLADSTSTLDETPGNTAATPVGGFAAMPAPDGGDVFLDFEGHPFWRADTGLFFLFGWIERAGSGDWEYKALWAHDPAGEAVATEQLVGHLAARRERFPDMHVYHYNHTERTSLVRLTIEHGVAELELERLIQTGMFVDLLPVIKGAMQVGTEGYGLKDMERLARFERGHGIDRGAGAVVEYEKWMADRAADHLDRIRAYNEDDVRATRALRDWLVGQRPDGSTWRPAVVDANERDVELDARIEALHASASGTVEHLMGDLLGYWRRERSAVNAEAYRLSIADEPDQMESMAAITRLSFVGLEPQISQKTRRALSWSAAVFTFPPQAISPDIDAGERMITALSEHEWAFFDVVSIDRDAGELRLKWTAKCVERGMLPTSLAHYSWYREGAKMTALQLLADEMLAGAADRVGHSMLRRDLARFVPGSGPAGGAFAGDVVDICRWATGLDRSFVPIQGPPGTGKTYIGAHLIRALVSAGKRVGVAAMSHHAVDNLMAAVIERFEEEGAVGELRAVRKASHGPVRHVEYIDDNAKCAEGDFNVIGGTSWLFASEAMRDHPVDVLVVDEAGQLGLADTLAASVSATNVILLGDPQQLAQVVQAGHPNGAGASALQHVLGTALTVGPDRGVLLDVTWRMHPDVCRFISDVMYEGKLTSHPSCAGQSTAAGTGLRWIPAVHEGCATESPVEADLVAAAIGELLGRPWTDHHGVTRPLAASDFMVVAPYNDQVRCIRARLAEDGATSGVEVGTVDKFQGREAAVVLFSMATSSSAFMPRTADFLFSKNRLNVAVSRARCLTYLICTDRLLDTRARTVEEMALVSALCSFVERAACVRPDMARATMDTPAVGVRPA